MQVTFPVQISLPGVQLVELSSPVSMYTSAIWFTWSSRWIGRVRVTRSLL